MSKCWVKYFSILLDAIKLKSKDPSTQVGAIITDHHNIIISTGYNGFPMGVDDSEERYENRELKYNLIVHAEMNAILLAARHGKSLLQTVLWVNRFPCCECAKAIIQSGIIKVNLIQNSDDIEFDKRWAKSIELSTIMFRESGVTVDKYSWSDHANKFWFHPIVFPEMIQPILSKDIIGDSL